MERSVDPFVVSCRLTRIRFLRLRLMFADSSVRLPMQSLSSSVSRMPRLTLAARGTLSALVLEARSPRPIASKLALVPVCKLVLLSLLVVLFLPARMTTAKPLAAWRLRTTM
jgi:hypothetical protein